MIMNYRVWAVADRKVRSEHRLQARAEQRAQELDAREGCQRFEVQVRLSDGRWVSVIDLAEGRVDGFDENGRPC